MIAYIDRELLPAPTIRHVECEVLLTAGSKQQQCCRACCRHRGSLRSLLSRRKVASPKTTTLAHSHTNDRYLSTPKRKEKVKRQRVNLKEQRRRIRKLKRTVKKLTRDGMMVDNATHEDLVTIMEENVKEVASKYPEKSFPRLFWSQQLQAAKQKNSKSMKWHPVMVRWCIYLRHISGKGYNQLRDSGCLSLPSQRSLRDYTYYNRPCTGFSTGTDEELLRLLESKGYEEWQRMVLLLIDEMYIKEDIVYNKHTGRIVGFTDLGDVNNHLLRQDYFCGLSLANSM